MIKLIYCIEKQIEKTEHSEWLKILIVDMSKEPEYMFGIPHYYTIQDGRVAHMMGKAIVDNYRQTSKEEYEAQEKRIYNSRWINAKYAISTMMSDKQAQYDSVMAFRDCMIHYCLFCTKQVYNGRFFRSACKKHYDELLKELEGENNEK